MKISVKYRYLSLCKEINLVTSGGALWGAAKVLERSPGTVNEKARKLCKLKRCIAVDKVEKHLLSEVKHDDINLHPSFGPLAQRRAPR